MTSLSGTVQEQVEGHEDKGIATLLKMQQTNPELLVGVALNNLVADAQSGNAQKVLQSGIGMAGQPSVLDRQASALADGSLLNAASRVGPGIQQRGNQIAQQQRYPGMAQQPGIGGQPGLGGAQVAQNQRRRAQPGMRMNNMQARNPTIGTTTPTGLPTMRSNLPQAAAQGGIIGYDNGGKVQPIPAFMDKYGNEMVMEFLEGEKQLRAEAQHVAPQYADAFQQKRDNFYSHYPREFIEELYETRGGPIDISEEVSMAGGGIVGLANGGSIKGYQEGDQVEGGGGFSDWRRRWLPNPTVNRNELLSGQEFLLEQGFSWDQINDMKDSEIAEWGYIRDPKQRRGTTGDLMELFQRFERPLVGDRMTELPNQGRRSGIQDLYGGAAGGATDAQPPLTGDGRDAGISAASLAQINATRDAAFDGPAVSTDSNVELPSVSTDRNEETSGYPAWAYDRSVADFLGGHPDAEWDDLTREQQLMRRMEPPEGRYPYWENILPGGAEGQERPPTKGIGGGLGQLAGEGVRYGLQDSLWPTLQYMAGTVGDFIKSGYQSSGLEGLVDESDMLNNIPWKEEGETWGDTGRRYLDRVDEIQAEMEAEREAERLQDEHQRGLEGFGASLETAIEEGLTDEERLQKLLTGGYGRWEKGDVLEAGEFVGSGAGGSGAGGVGTGGGRTRRDRIDGDTSGVAGQVTTDPNVWDQIQRVTNILGKGAGSSAGWEGINISKGLQAERALEAERGFERDQMKQEMQFRTDLLDRELAAASSIAQQEAIRDLYESIMQTITADPEYTALEDELMEEFGEGWFPWSQDVPKEDLTAYADALQRGTHELIMKRVEAIMGTGVGTSGAIGEITDYTDLVGLEE